MEPARKCLLDTRTCLEVDLGAAAVLGTLGGDHNHTAGCRSTVERGGRRILEDGHALHVVGVERTACDAVHHIERVGAGRDGAGTADTDLGAFAGLSAGIHDHDAGSFTLDHVTQVGSGVVNDFIAAKRNYGTGEFVLLLGCVTHHDDLIQEVYIFFHEDFDFVATVHLLHYIGITEKVEGEGGVLTSLDRKITVQVGDCATSGRNKHADSGERFAGCGIFH